MPENTLNRELGISAITAAKVMRSIAEEDVMATAVVDPSPSIFAGQQLIISEPMPAFGSVVDPARGNYFTCSFDICEQVLSLSQGELLPDGRILSMTSRPVTIGLNEEDPVGWLISAPDHARAKRIRVFAKRDTAVRIDLTGDDVRSVSISVEKGAQPLELGLDKKTTLVTEFISYKELEPGWDGPGSVRPSQEALDDALAFIELLPPQLELEPMVSADGEVGFFKRTPDSYVDIGFRGNARISYYVRHRDRIIKGVKSYGRNSMPRELQEILEVV